ncbi:uncharacterized protein LOC120075037 [Benincasa hispida]|uniref:uncharacterized protein LOC120075037 n=1 Tax=Benincasa hispida TaxID=102211 RepID=UPI0019001B69|nr:uncharacterized protein LOC120075037 [Benincasa hispida]
MDPPPPQSATTAPTTKLRLMCSYGGHITTRPRTKTFSYLGGETRIISVDPTTVNTLSAFISHLLTILPIKSPFSLKYHLPHSALDSLISLSSDDDLHFMFCEHLRLSSSSSSSSRIRLFLFSPEPEKPHNVIHHPKTEAWFVDALKSAKILQKGRDCLVGFDGEGLIGENEVKGVVDLGNGGFSLPESMVLETSSSFGSSSSSASLANVSPPTKPQTEDFGLSSLDNAATLQTASDSIATLASEIAPTNSCSSVENTVMSIPVISESNFHNLAAGVRPQNPHDFSGYALASRPNPFQQQKLQFVQASAAVESCLPAVYQMPSYYPVQQPQFVHYQPMPNHVYPVYFLPVGQTQLSAPSNLPVQWGLRDAATASSTHTLVLPDASPVVPLPHVAYKEVMPEPHSQNLGAMPSLANPISLESADEVQQQPVIIPNDAAADTSGEVAHTRNECNEDDPARTLIYKSQPLPPLVPSPLQSKPKASTNLLSDAMAQLHMIKIEQ